MKRETKQKLLYKRESERTKTEKLIRDIACYSVVIYAAILGFLLVDANANLANAQAELVSNSIAATQSLN